MLDRLSKNPFVLGLFLLLISMFFGVLFTLPALAIQWFKTLYSPQDSFLQGLSVLVVYISNLLASSFILGYFYSKYHKETLSSLQKKAVPLIFIFYSFLIGETIALVEKKATQTETFLHTIKAQLLTLEDFITVSFSIVLSILAIGIVVMISKWALGKGSQTGF